MLLAREASELMAHGYVSDPVPEARSAYGNPDLLGGAWQWLTSSAEKLGPYLPGPLGQILPPIAHTVGKMKSLKPIDILAGIGESAMEGPVGEVIVGIGQGVAGWDPEAAVRDIWNRRDELKDIRTGGDTTDKGDKGLPDGEGEDGAETGGGDTIYNYYGSEDGTKEGETGTTIHNYYYYDEQDEQAVNQAADDGIMGSFMEIFLMFMMIMPMMQGMGGLGQVIQAEPKQKDMSGWLY